MSVEQFKAFRDHINGDLKLQQVMVAERMRGNSNEGSSRSLMDIAGELGFEFSREDFLLGMGVEDAKNSEIDDSELSDFELEMVQAALSPSCGLPDGCPLGNTPVKG